MKATTVLVACAGLLVAGCGGPKVSEEDRSALEAALVAYWQKEDTEAQPKLKTAQIDGNKATIEFSLKFPEFHSIATTRTGRLVKADGQWTVTEVSE